MESKHSVIFNSNEVVNSICQIIAGRIRAKDIPIDGLQKEIQNKFSRTYSRDVLIESLKDMQAQFPNCKFVSGRRGRKSRLEFSKSLIELCKELQTVSDSEPISEEVVEIQNSPKFIASIKADSLNAREHIVSVSADNCVQLVFPPNGFTEEETNRLIAFVRALAS